MTRQQLYSAEFEPQALTRVGKSHDSHFQQLSPGDVCPCSSTVKVPHRSPACDDPLTGVAVRSYVVVPKVTAKL